MAPVFVYPLAFLGLLALPALVAIYVLRNRHRPQVVSSLLLWLDVREARAGGPRIRRLQTPLLFFLELLLLVLLALAAAGPHLPAAEGARPLVVVLDDSFSMLAGGDDSVRSRAVRAIQEELRRMGRPSVRFVLAGERPSLLGDPVRAGGEVARALEGWRCLSPAASLEEALAAAAEVGGELALLLVVTDQKPEREPEKGRVQWWAFGEPRPNVAIVAAARTARDGADRCLFEIANFSDEGRQVAVGIGSGGNAALPQRVLDIPAGASQRITLELQPGVSELFARLPDDDLAVDDHATLLPPPVRRVRVDVQVADRELRSLVEKAVEATGIAEARAVGPDVVLTDAPGTPDEGPDTWVVQFLVEKEAEAYVGPFVLDRAHPLTEGLALQGVIWGAGKSSALPGAPVVMAGNVPLLTDSESPSGAHHLRLRLRPDLSTLQDAPGWPVLIANLVQWQASQQPGLGRPNVRLGEDAVLTFAGAPPPVRLVAPDGSTRGVPVQQRRAVARAEQVGVYELWAGDEKMRFASNAVRREESDLRDRSSGRWGDWLDETSLRLEYRSVAWVLLLVALGVATLHMVLAGRGRAARGDPRRGAN